MEIASFDQSTPEPQSTAALSAEQLEMNEIVEDLKKLSTERDTWKRLAKMYKQGFDEISSQAEQFRDLLFATRAELENERLSNNTRHSSHLTAVPEDRSQSRWMLESDWISTALTRQHFSGVEKSITIRNHQGAIIEVEAILRKQLGVETRLEGTLLRAAIFRASGMFLEAMNDCNEALVLCSRHPNLRAMRPKANFGLGLCLYKLSNYPEASIAFSAIGADEFYHQKAKKYLQACLEAQKTVISHASQKCSNDEGRETAQGEIPHESRDAASAAYEKLRAHNPLGSSVDISYVAPIINEHEFAFRTFLDPLGIRRPAGSLSESSSGTDVKTPSAYSSIDTSSVTDKSVSLRLHSKDTSIDSDQSVRSSKDGVESPMFPTILTIVANPDGPQPKDEYQIFNAVTARPRPVTSSRCGDI